MMTYTIVYRVNIGRYEPFTATLTGCTKVSFEVKDQWVLFDNSEGKPMFIPACNIVSITQE